MWRLAFSMLIVGIALLITGQWRDWGRLTGRQAALAVLSGFALALHFWAWNASIHLTTIAASVTLVSMQPAFIVVISAVFLRETPTIRQLAGIALAMLGAILISSAGWSADGTDQRGALLGNLLALSAAATAAIYYSIGRHLRAGFGVWSYVGLVYAACTAALMMMAWISDAQVAPQPPREIAIFAALALGPMLLGHTGMNWALKYMPAYVVNLVVLGEPVGATLLGALIPGIEQVPSPATLAGGAIVLTGVIIAARRRVPAAGEAT